MIDFDRFDWGAIFSTIDEVQTLNDNASKMNKGLIIEMTLAKHSDGQLTWMDGVLKGYDLVDEDGLRYEVKSLADGWASKTAKDIVIGNHRTDKKESREQEYDHLIFVAGDHQVKSVHADKWVVAVADYEDTLPYVTSNSADIKIKKMPSYLFEKVAFADMHDATGDARQKFLDLMWEMA